MKKLKSNHRLRYTLVFLALIAFVVGGSMIRQRTVKARTGASVSTNKSDYYPGEKVTISGSGWQAFETVTLTIYESDGDTPWQATATADEVGSFTNTDFVIQDHDVGVSFALYAAGSSGEQATAAFTDSPPPAQPTGTGVVTITSPSGSCLAATAPNGSGPYNWEVAEGGSYVMTISGVTECEGDTIKAFVQNSDTGNFCITLTKNPDGTYSGAFTMPANSCNTSPISYKCDVNGGCDNADTYNAQGPDGAGTVHLRANTWGPECSTHVQDTDCTSTPTPSPTPQECTISCPQNITVECGTSTDPSVTGSATTTGGCGVTYTDTFAPGCGGTGTITRHWSTTGTGPTASCDQLITIVDTTPPTISNAGPDATIYCPNTPTFTPPTASDSCGAATIVEDSDVTVNGSCGTYSRTKTWHAVDSCGNVSGQKSQTIVVECNNCGGLTMGFWQNKNGQAIIKASTGSSLSTFLRNYNPFQDLPAGSSASTTATYIMNVIKAASASGASMNAMLKAQMLATALDVFFSDPGLGGNKIGAPAPLGGVKIDLTYINKPIGSATYEDTSSAFGGGGCQTVLALLAYASSQSDIGGVTWYGQIKTTQELAKDTFDAINNNVAYSCL
jgi:hypothetical protein